MPNKRKLSKLVTKQLSKGKLNANKNVQEALNEIRKKVELNNEDIDFDFENIKNTDFEKLDDNDDDTKKVSKSSAAKSKHAKKQAEKRKHANNENIEIDNKKPKLDVDNKKNVAIPIPKKSKKNKYFFIAHPEALAKTENLTNERDESLKQKFVIDEEKIKLNEAKKIKNKNKNKNEESTKKNGLDNKKNNKKVAKNKLWTFEECTSSDEDEDDKNGEFKSLKKNTKGNMLDITDIDKSFKLKKKIEIMPDGSKVETLVPEFVQTDEAEDEENEEDVNLEREENEIEESEEEKEETKSVVKKKENASVKDKLLASRFRYLNEMLYKQESSESFDYFKNDKDAFIAYHEGFKSQIDKWPINPLDEIIKYIKSKPANMIVADFGCGEARIAQSVKNKVHSFDLVAVNDHVTECDMKNVPLPDNTCDIAVFCLSLMGTNVVDFVKEANRVLKSRGVLKIAEVVSRIDDKTAFIRGIEALGFKLVGNKKEEKTQTSTNNKDYFYFFDFVKVNKPTNKKVEIKLQPCLYKKR